MPPRLASILAFAILVSTPIALTILHHAEEIFLNEPPVVLVYWYTRVYLLQPSVKGWHPLAQDYHPYKFMDLADTQP